MRGIIKIFQILEKSQKLRFFKLLFLMTIVGLLEMVSIGSIIPLLSSVTSQKTEISWLNNNILNNDALKLNDLSFLIFSALLIMIAFSLKNIFIFMYTNYASKFMFFLSLDQQKKTFEKYISYNFSDIFEKDTSEILRDINIESRMIAAQFFSPLLSVLLSLITLIFLTVMMFFYNFYATLFLCIFTITAFFLFEIAYNKKMKDLGKERISSQKKVLKSIKQTFDGIKELIIYNKVDFYAKNFLEKITSLSLIGVKRAVISVIPKLIIETFVVFFFLISIFFIYIHLQIELLVIIGTVSVYVLIGFRYLPILLSLLTNYQKINFSQPSVNLIFNLLKKKSNDIKNIRLEKKITFFTDNLSFKNVSFAYGKNQVFTNLSFNIKKNSLVGITGPSGSGKSTLVELLFKLREPNSGGIFIDKKNIKNYCLDNNLFGYVQQKVQIFNETLLSNITFENNIKNVDLKKFNKALKFSELNNFIKKLKNGIQTNLGENGKKISEGQRQRIGIARAIYKGSKILLLDEALSSLDSVNKKIILKNIIKLKINMTVIYISHDIREFELFDKIIKL
jgi:ATP-binding cassette subfamily B protein